MKIGILHYSSPPIVGGVESVIADHARLMTKAGHHVTILTGRGKSFEKQIPIRVIPRLDSRHAEVMHVKSQLDEGLCQEPFEILKSKIKNDLIKELDQLDVLIAHNIASLHKNLALTAALHELLTEHKLPRLILWHHDLAWTTPRYRSELHNGYPWDLLRIPWDQATQVVISEMRQVELCRLQAIPDKSIRVIPNGVDINRFFKLEPQTIQLIEKTNMMEADPLFLLPVRITPRKNIELAVRVLAELKKDLPNAMLLVTGPEGPHNPANAAYKLKIQNLIKEENLQGSAILLADISPGFLPDPVIADFYKLADALLFPSREEGFGIPVIEAGFSAIPVFCSDIPPFRELGEGDITYFNPDAAPERIAKKIIVRLLSEATLRWSRRAKHKYAWNAIYSHFIEPVLEEG